MIERYLLIALLREPSKIIRFFERKINGKCFSDPVLGKIFDIISWCYKKFNTFPNDIELRALLEKSKMNDDQKREVLLTYTDLLKSQEEVNFDIMFNQFLEALKRRLLEETVKSTLSALNSQSVDTIISSLKEDVARLDLVSRERIEEMSISDVTLRQERLEKGLVQEGIPTGFPTFDRITGGLRPGQLVVVVSGVKEGKTTFLLNVGYHAFSQGKNVLFITTEMSVEQISLRFDSRATGIPYSKLRDCSLTEEERISYKEYLDSLSKRQNKFYICDVPGITPSGVFSKIKELGPFDIVIVDYLGLMLSDREVSSGWERISVIMEDLKRVALSENVVILTAAQVNREGVKTKSDEYGIEFIALSFTIPAHADMVISIRLENRELLQVSDVCTMIASVLVSRETTPFKFVIDAFFGKMLLVERQDITRMTVI